jgi:hypothetical protein
VPRGLAILLALAFLAAGCLGGGDGSSASQGESLVLSQSDVGDEFTQFDKGSQRLSDLTPPRDEVDRFGRKGGWKARFSRPGTRTTDGPLVISSLADLFGSEDGARKDFELYEQFVGGFEATGGERIGISDPALGDEFAAVTYQQGLPPNVTTYYVIAWRTGNVTASLNLNGFKLTWEQAVALADKQDQRIRAAQ